MIIYCGDRVLADRIQTADSFLKRFVGLMGRERLAEGEGLLLLDCRSIHCFFMKLTIDAVYLSADMKVLGTETLKPWRVGRIFKDVRHVLELPAGMAGKAAVGDTISIQGK